MIECFFNEEGYYITGDGLMIVNNLSPRTINGELVLDPLQHLYAILYCALCELKGIQSNKIIVYNDSRIIDDLNGHVPLDPWYETIRRMIRQRILPEICSVVFFRKQSAKEIGRKIEDGISKLSVKDNKRDDLLRRKKKEWADRHKSAINKKATELKRRWFDAKA